MAERNNNFARISFSDMREMVKGRKTDDKTFFLEHDFAMAKGYNSVFDRVLNNSAPFLVEDSRFILLMRGEADVTLNLMNQKFHKGMLVYVGRGSVAQINRITPDFWPYAMIMGDDFLNFAFDGRLPVSFCGRESSFHILLSEKDMTMLGDMMRIIWDVVHQSDFSQYTVLSMASAFVNYVDWLRQRQMASPLNERTREREVFEQFITLVNTYCRDERRLAFYADKMCMCERYLGTLVRKASGITAKEWIDKAVITAAKVMLCHTSMSVNEIAYRLHFANDSFFCKYFRRLTGSTPSTFKAEYDRLKNVTANV